MALQKTGQISLSNIATEKGVSLQNLSLQAESVFRLNQFSALKPDGSAPHGVSEFYGYNHLFTPAPTLTSFAASELMFRSKAFDACGLETRSTAYHNGSGQYPAVGDKVYANSSGSTVLGWGAAAYGREQAFETDSSSTVISLVMCGDVIGGPGGDIIKK
tara:strand:- start:210 stop:689 length:480 start_codon:yes stop_codon:yes gene_type:complete